MLPNPFLTDEQRIMREPDWSRLDLWDRLRRKYLGLGPGPAGPDIAGFFPTHREKNPRSTRRRGDWKLNWPLTDH